VKSDVLENLESAFVMKALTQTTLRSTATRYVKPLTTRPICIIVSARLSHWTVTDLSTAKTTLRCDESESKIIYVYLGSTLWAIYTALCLDLNAA
jgi:hypothetical protein